MDLNFETTILAFSDGACSGNPGRGGYGVVIAHPEGRIEELGGGRSATTNNRMELMGVIAALEALEDSTNDLWMLTDSTYVIRGITQWIWGWKKKGWKTASGSEVSNKDLWQRLDRLVTGYHSRAKIHWKYVRGHAGIPGNERCDEIAVGFTKKQSVSLYEGSLLEYPVAIHDLPDDMSLPPMKSKTAKKAAHSYLSLVNGQLERHSTWKECEARVKGRPGAKFKKSTSSANEIEIAESWGLNSSHLAKLD